MVLVNCSISSTAVKPEIVPRSLRQRGSVTLEEYRADGLYLEGVVKSEDLHVYQDYMQ